MDLYFVKRNFSDFSCLTLQLVPLDDSGGIIWGCQTVENRLVHLDSGLQFSALQTTNCLAHFHLFLDADFLALCTFLSMTVNFFFGHFAHLVFLPLKTLRLSS